MCRRRTLDKRKECTALNTEKFQKIREEQYPLAEKCVYLDTATTGLISENSKTAMLRYITDRCEQGISLDGVVERWAFADEFRKPVAQVINADSEEIFFGAGCSEMLNIFSNGIELCENANVVTSGLSFPSNVYNWASRVSDENIRIVPAENGQVSAQSLFDHCDENTAVIALCLVENSTGFRHDIETISAFCKQKGIYFLLDITQCVTALDVDVKKVQVDFLVASAYKWLCGPFGIAFGYASRRVLDKIKMSSIGWVGNKDRFKLKPLGLNLSDNANRFECSSPSWLSLKCMEQSVKMYLALGKEEVQHYILGLTDYLYEKIAPIEHIGVVGPFEPKNRSGISYITFPSEWNLTDDILAGQGIRAHVASENTMRIAFHYYNNKSDVDALCKFFESYYLV